MQQCSGEAKPQKLFERGAMAYFASGVLQEMPRAEITEAAGG